MSGIRTIQGGITAPVGFTACGVQAGIKAERPDIALVYSAVGANAAGVFTKNRIQAAPVKLCRARLSKNGLIHAMVVNSGNANACTGDQGAVDAEKMAALAADGLGIAPETVLVCSTGTIGVPMPMARVAAGIRTAVDALVPDGGEAAARAIMTTDTRPKTIAVEFQMDGRPVRIGGMAKGSGMIQPNMATMLAFLTTDAAVEPSALQRCLLEIVDDTFNRITVDGDQSTNDSVLLLANGAAGNSPAAETHPDWRVFKDGLLKVAWHLALEIVKDGEGATKLVTVEVSGAASSQDAEKVARSVANSLLVKTSWYGADPNWGRIIDAVGYSGAEVAEESVDIGYEDLLVVKGGKLASGVDLERVKELLKRPEFAVKINLNLGDGASVVYTCDLSHEYVRINADYTT